MNQQQPIQQGRVYPATVFFTGKQGDMVLHQSDRGHLQMPLTFNYNNGNFRANAEAAVRQWLTKIGIKPGCIQSIEVSDADVRDDGHKAYCRVVLKSGGVGNLGTNNASANHPKDSPGLYRTPLATFANSIGESFGLWLLEFSGQAASAMARG